MPVNEDDKAIGSGLNNKQEGIGRRKANLVAKPSLSIIKEQEEPNERPKREGAHKALLTNRDSIFQFTGQGNRRVQKPSSLGSIEEEKLTPGGPGSSL